MWIKQILKWLLLDIQNIYHVNYAQIWGTSYQQDQKHIFPFEVR